MKLKEKIKTIIEKIHSWIYDTLRFRKKSDYDSFTKETMETNVPWFYIRIFILLFFIFTIGIFITDIFKFGVRSETLVIGASFYAFTFLFFFYELNNKKEIGVPGLIGILLISLSSVLVVLYIVTYVFPTENDYLIALRAGVGEEFVKGVYAILICFIIQKVRKKKYSLGTILLIGLTVGAAFEIAENLLYLEYTSYGSATNVTFSRGECGLVTHMGWTAMITYAFFKFKKPLINLKFYAFVLYSMAIHTLWDISEVDFMNQTLFTVLREIVLDSHIIVSIIFCIYIVLKYNNKPISKNDIENKKFSYKEGMHLVSIITLMILVVIGCHAVILNANDKLYEEKEVYEYYSTYDEFKFKVQGNRDIYVDEDRPYDNTLLDSFSIYKYDVKVSAQQTITIDDIDYIYCYSLNNDTLELELCDIYLEIDGIEVYQGYLYIINGDDSKSYPYYDVIRDTIKPDEWCDDVFLIETDKYGIDDNMNVYLVDYEDVLYPVTYVLIGLASFILLVGIGIILIIYVRRNKKMNIYIYGDSNTWGYVPSEVFYTGDDSITKRYDKNEMWWRDIALNNNAIINGNNGRTTAYDHDIFAGKNAAKTIDDDLTEIDCKIDLLIIMLGTNDMKKIYNASEEEIADNLFKLIDRIKEKLGCKVLVVCPPYIVSGTKKTDICFDHPEERIDKYHDILENKCKDFGYYFTSFIGAEIGVDGEHLTINGQEFARNIINEEIKNIKTRSSK